MGVRLAQTCHGVLNETDDDASHPANIDLACMLVFFMGARTIVEAGTYRGHFAFAVANILRQTSGGMVYTADVTDYISGHLLGDASLFTPHIHFYHGDFLAMLPQVPVAIDLAYIDASDLNNEHLRMQHAEAAYERLAPGGLILVDDTAATDWADAAKFREWAGIQFLQHRGLTIIQKANHA